MYMRQSLLLPVQPTASKKNWAEVLILIAIGALTFLELGREVGIVPGRKV